MMVIASSPLSAKRKQGIRLHTVGEMNMRWRCAMNSRLRQKVHQFVISSSLFGNIKYIYIRPCRIGNGRFVCQDNLLRGNNSNNYIGIVTSFDTSSLFSRCLKRNASFSPIYTVLLTRKRYLVFSYGILQKVEHNYMDPY